MIRPTVPADTPILLKLAESTGVFKPHEITALDEVLTDYHAENQALGHRCVSLEEDGQLIGFSYYAPSSMGDRTWYLWWIAVSKEIQARGIGSALLRYTEDDIRRERGRVMFIETSSAPYYDLTRRFYLKHGYDQEAVLRDFYAEGDSMVIFRKGMTNP
jgi:ribosomal protein S18 acetylase RimI-like enzyme